MGRRKKLTEKDILKARLNRMMDEILELLEDYEVEEYTCHDKLYDYLNEDDRVIVVKNPYSPHHLIIEKTEDVCVYFHAWQSRCYFTDNDFIELKSELKGILENRHAAIIPEPFLRWTGIVLFKNDASCFTETTILCKTDLTNGIDMAKRGLKGEIKICYWDSKYDFSFKMEDGSQKLFEFPKRYIVRLVIENENVVAWSHFIKIRNSPICMVPVLHQNIYLERILAQLEIDITRARGKHIYILSTQEQFDFYHQHGYCLTEDYPNIKETLGKEVEYMGVFEKILD